MAPGNTEEARFGNPTNGMCFCGGHGTRGKTRYASKAATGADPTRHPDKGCTIFTHTQSTTCTPRSYRSKGPASKRAHLRRTQAKHTLRKHRPIETLKIHRRGRWIYTQESKRERSKPSRKQMRQRPKKEWLHQTGLWSSPHRTPTNPSAHSTCMWTFPAVVTATTTQTTRHTLQFKQTKTSMTI